MTQKTYIVTEEQAGQRLDSVCASVGLYNSRSAAAKFISMGEVFVNSKPQQKRYKVCAGDVITYAPQPQERFNLEPENIALDIRFEDEHLIVLSKQAGLVCHPAPNHPSHTLVNALVYHCGADNLCHVQNATEAENDTRPGIVHRLDADTSGLMLVAKTDVVGKSLMQQIQDREVDRHYIALVHGNIKNDDGVIDAPIVRHPKDRTRFMALDSTTHYSQTLLENARTALTTYRVLERFHTPENRIYTLVDCKLFTGRTHQIRVHMEHIKHPVVGDSVYCKNLPKKSRSRTSNFKREQLGLDRQFLHSYILKFTHPITSQDLCFTDTLPTDLEAVYSKLKERV